MAYDDTFKTLLTLAHVIEVCVKETKLGCEFADLGAGVLTCCTDVHFILLDLVQVADVTDAPDAHQTRDTLHVFITGGRNLTTSSSVRFTYQEPGFITFLSLLLQ